MIYATWINDRTNEVNSKRHGRYEHSAIIDRPDFSWPDGKRLAVYLGMNLECFDFGGGLGARLVSADGQPDVLNYAWRDYGNRVGVWRLLDIFDRLSLPCTALVNSDIYRHAPGVVEAFRARGDEIAGHGRTNAEKQGNLGEDAERRLIGEATAEIACREGSPPKGWLGPWISQSVLTPDLLDEAGYEYHLDWCHDDQPVWMKTRKGRILSVPYPQELNDIPQIVGRRKEAGDFAAMIMDTFDWMLAESRRRPLMMGIALHAYIMGHPHRAHHLQRVLGDIVEKADETVWFTTSGAINDHYRTLDISL